MQGNLKEKSCVIIFKVKLLIILPILYKTQYRNPLLIITLSFILIIILLYSIFLIKQKLLYFFFIKS
jgi:hypothetical protein